MALVQLYEEAGITADALNHTGTLTFVFDDQEEPWEVHGEHLDGPLPSLPCLSLMMQRCSNAASR